MLLSWYVRARYLRSRSPWSSQAGQTTAEYALVILAAAAIAVVLIVWARSSGSCRRSSTASSTRWPGVRPSDGERDPRRSSSPSCSFGAAPAARARADRRARPRSVGPDAGLARRGARATRRPVPRDGRRGGPSAAVGLDGDRFGSRSIERVRGVRRSRSLATTRRRSRRRLPDGCSPSRSRCG